MTTTALVYEIDIKENPARRLHSVMEAAGYQNPAEFIIKALDVFEKAISCGGKVVVEDEREGRKYIFKIVGKGAPVTGRSPVAGRAVESSV